MNFKCCVPCLNAPSALHVKEWGHSLSISMSYAEGLRPSGLLSLINTIHVTEGKGEGQELLLTSEFLACESPSLNFFPSS